MHKRRSEEEEFDWTSVRGQTFDDQEARDASDFGALMRSYFVDPSMYLGLAAERELRVGHRLYLVENLPVEEIGKFMMGEEDERLIAIARDRNSEDKIESQGGIYFPGD